MKKFISRLMSRRGVAMEFAIGVMFITVAVSTILLSTAIHQKNLVARDKDDFEQKVAVEQYAESVVLSACRNLESIETKRGDYSAALESYTTESGSDAIRVEIKETDKELLIITLVKNSEKYEITSWDWQ